MSKDRQRKTERHNITLTDAQWRALKREAKRKGLRGASSVIQAYADCLMRKGAD